MPRKNIIESGELSINCCICCPWWWGPCHPSSFCGKAAEEGRNILSSNFASKILAAAAVTASLAGICFVFLLVSGLRFVIFFFCAVVAVPAFVASPTTPYFFCFFFYTSFGAGVVWVAIPVVYVSPVPANAATLAAAVVSLLIVATMITGIYLGSNLIVLLLVSSGSGTCLWGYFCSCNSSCL